MVIGNIMGATHDGAIVWECPRWYFVIGLGIHRPGRDALVRSFDQRLQNLDGTLKAAASWRSYWGRRPKMFTGLRRQMLHPSSS